MPAMPVIPTATSPSNAPNSVGNLSQNVSSKDNSAASSSDAGATQPFAAVLQKQIKSAPGSANASKDGEKTSASDEQATTALPFSPEQSAELAAWILTNFKQGLPGAESQTASGLAGDGSAQNGQAGSLQTLAASISALGNLNNRSGAGELAGMPSSDGSSGKNEAMLQSLTSLLSGASGPGGNGNPALANADQSKQTVSFADLLGQQAAKQAGGQSGDQADAMAAIVAAASEELVTSGKAGPADQSVNGIGQDLAANAMTQASNLSGTGKADAIVSKAVTTPLGAAGWTQEVGNHVSWMANQHVAKADLVLNPPQMGRIEVSLTIQGDQATANFVAANAAVRDALEQSLPKLRETLADIGINLGQAQVGSDSPGQSANQREKGDNSARSLSIGGVSEIAGTKTDVGSANLGTSSGRGMVDTFA